MCWSTAFKFWRASQFWWRVYVHTRAPVYCGVCDAPSCMYVPESWVVTRRFSLDLGLVRVYYNSCPCQICSWIISPANIDPVVGGSFFLGGICSARKGKKTRGVFAGE